MNSTEAFDDFLRFEQKVFGEQLPIPAYDSVLIRYGEYRFVTEMMAFRPGESVLDLGCESNVFILYLAYLEVRALGVDLNPRAGDELKTKKRQAEQATGRKLHLEFRAEDATQLRLPAQSVDKAIAISSIEHMFSKKGRGDELAMAGLARVLKPGGLAVVTSPMSNGGPFHESPTGDARFGAPYRLYTPETLEERILSQPDLETVRLSYLAQTTPDPRYPHLHFFRFWTESLSPQERQKWAWANPILARIFNPIISPEEGKGRLETVNTALICLRKKA
jgi:SAM-dependent methyltransferase